MFKNISHIIVVLLVAATMGACRNGNAGGNNVYTSLEGNVWHTTMHITYGADRDLSAQVMAVADSVERSLSPFLANSRISAVNSNADLSVDGSIIEVFHESVRINGLSGGAFDPTVAPLVNLWGFGYDGNGSEPSKERIDSCLALVGIADCRIENGMMVKKSPGTQFNFSAITKGYGIDCMARMLDEQGIENYMIEIGGEVAVRGVNQRAEKWHIQIDSPESGKEGHEQLAVIEVTDCSLATSGNYRNYRDTKHGRVGHTISPTTGCPIADNVVSATVIAPSTMTADALATALMAMDTESGLAMIEGTPSVEAMLVVAADGDTLRTVTTSGFPQFK